MDQNIEQIELEISEAKQFITMADALERLRNNRDFQRVISEGYMRDEAIRLVQCKAAPNLQKPELQAAIVQAMDAIGGLQQYFNKIYTQADMARNAIEASEEEIAALEAEAEETVA